MPKTLVVDPDKCTSCRLCELVCTQRNIGPFQPTKARIQVAIDVDNAEYFPRVCFQCEEAHCVEACPSEALVRDPDTHIVNLHKDNCIECGQCAEACPYGVIDCSDGLPRKCEQCGGDPECVQFCTAEALRFEDADTWTTRQAYADRLAALAKEA